MPLRYKYALSFVPGVEIYVRADCERILHLTPGWELSVRSNHPGFALVEADAPVPVEQLRQMPWLEGLFALVHCATVAMGEEGLPELCHLLSGLDWSDALSLWQHHRCEAGWDEPGPSSFRVTADRETWWAFPSDLFAESEPDSRQPKKHEYRSVDIEKAVGEVVWEKTQWPARMKGFDLEFYVHVFDCDAILGLSIVHITRRPVVEHCVMTTLRAGVVDAMRRLALLDSPAQIVIDPMCGAGSVPIAFGDVRDALPFRVGVERRDAVQMCRAQAIPRAAWPPCHAFGGDSSAEALGACLRNSRAAAGDGLRCDFVRWDACALPLRSACVDRIVVDLPFGNKCGSHHKNSKTYHLMLDEMHRVLADGGLAVLLTRERPLMLQYLTDEGNLLRWAIRSLTPVYMNMNCTVFCLAKRALAPGSSQPALTDAHHRPARAVPAWQRISEPKRHRPAPEKQALRTPTGDQTDDAS
jgi:SAM-dependent methyltransferase